MALVVSACGLFAADAEQTTDGSDSGPEEGQRDYAGQQDWVEPQFRRFEEAVVTDLTYGGAGLERWREDVPGIADVRIASTYDDYEQPALWLAPEGDGPRPLLVVLHSWSVDYQQHLGIPYAKWAQENGWAMIHPDFRGVLSQPEATGSEGAVQDVLDAIDFAAAHADIDTDHVFITGFSGGGMMTLLMAGRHPERFAGAVAWVPIHDLGAWHAYQPSADYAREIEQSCLGNPSTDPAAAEECAQRSPSAHLDAARDAGVPIYIGAGLADHIVPATHAVWAFNQLADPDHRLSEAQAGAIGAGSIPEELAGEIGEGTYFAEEDPPLVFARSSASVTLALFDGGHEGVYNPGLAWMVDQIRPDETE